MQDYLVFRLYGPFSSWGDVAVGEFRPSLSHPTRSAILGLMGAALGIRRDDGDGQAALSEGYGLAVRIDDAGTLLNDYQTVETPHARVVDNLAKKGRVPSTRREELVAAQAGEATKTNLSRREYRMDALYAAAVWLRAGVKARWGLGEIVAALQRPRFIPYLGRKSCSPALPFAPMLVSAKHPVEALRMATFAVDSLIQGRREQSVERVFRWEKDAAVEETDATRGRRLERRRDQPLSRTRWLFADREEYVLVDNRSTKETEAGDVPQQD